MTARRTLRQTEVIMSDGNLIERYTFRERRHPLDRGDSPSSCWRCPGWRCSIRCSTGSANLFGGGTWARILHPFIGVVLAVAFCDLARRFWHANRITAEDREWLR